MPHWTIQAFRWVTASTLLLTACGGGGGAFDASGSDGSAPDDPDLADAGFDGTESHTDAGAPDAAPSPPVRPTSDVLEALPDIVYLKTNTQSFNRLHYLAVMDGHLWVKPNVEVTGVDAPWAKVTVSPELEGRVAQVSVDDHGVVVFDDTRKLTWAMSTALTNPFSPVWTTSWGAPLSFGPGFDLPDGVRKWEFSVLTVNEDGFWIDTAGNAQSVGLGSVAHIWILHEDRQRITFVDPILPVDLSYEMCGPLRGRFKSENLSSSGSTAFVINSSGDMFTRLYDFDISGADTLFFQYSYEDQRGQPFPAFQLPAPGWVKQPKIDGEITDRITIFKTGIGSDSRVLRVEGRDREGNVGFYEKPITAVATADWVFRPTGQPLRGNVLDNDLVDRSEEGLGEAEDEAYARNLAAVADLDLRGDVVGDADWAAEIRDFNLYCSPATFTVHLGTSTTVDLILHTVDSIRQTPRARGLDAEPYVLQGTLEVPAEILANLDGQDPKVRAFVTGILGARRFTATPVSATVDRLTFDAFGWIFEHDGAP